MSTLEDIKARVEGHSPTPWQHQPWGGQNQNGDYSGGDVFDANGERVVSEVMDADGALIEAAPKLIAALEAVEEKLKWLDAIQAESAFRHNVNAGGTASVLREAINKALQ